MSKSKKQTNIDLNRRELAKHLLTGKYCRYRMNGEGASVCAVYQGNQQLVKYYYRYVSAEIEPYLKTDKNGRKTLHLHKIKALSGHHFLKKLYKALNIKQSASDSCPSPLKQGLGLSPQYCGG